MINKLKNGVNCLRHARNVARGWREFQRTGQTPAFAYQSLISLHCLTQGRSNDWIHQRIAQRNPVVPVEKANGILGDLAPSTLTDIGEKLRQDGFYIFENRLSAAACDELENFARTHPSVPFPPREGVPTSAIYDADNAVGTTYKFPEPVLLIEPILQELALDDSLLAVAQNYLGSAPILDMVTMWWSAPQKDNAALSSAHARSETAQLYHFDMDRVMWMKFFIYLTDVSSETGPHIFIRGSHQSGNQPSELLSKGYSRLSDEEVARFYGPESVVEITGARGTIVAEDTRGFHKGKPPITGERLILQIEFCDSLFGGEFSRPRVKLISQLQQKAASRPQLLSKYELESAS